MYCNRSNSFGYALVPQTYDISKKDVDGLRTLPVPAGRHDVYRVAASLTIYTKAVTTQDGNAVTHGTSTADAQFLTDPVHHPASENPAVEQMPVEIVVKPSNN